MWASGPRSAVLVAQILLATSVVGRRFHGLSRIINRAAVDPAPISFSPSQNWDGPDGPWSSFVLQVGTPRQNVRVLISTASQASWLVLPLGCERQPLNCPDHRGNLYFSNESTTWKETGNYRLGNEENLNLTNGAIWGNDTIGLGLQGSGGPTLDNQNIAGINTLDFYVGMFGVNPKPTNFTGLEGDQRDSYMTSLKKQNLIPSISFGYSAGAQYRLKKVLGTLTLGGYDAARFTPNDLSFSFAPDNDRDIVVGIQSIKSTTEAGETSDLLPSGDIIAYIDSTVPYFYLPADSCKAFEDAFGLEWNSERNLYLVSDELHTKLVAENATVTFTLGNNAQGGKTIDITLPYDSFDLQATWPVVFNASRYFPLKRATNETQYTLGRAFLQETYLIVDYERSNFSVSQALFQDGTPQNLQPIKALNPPPLTQTTDTSSSSTPKGRIAGIAVGVVLAVLICASAIAAFFYFRRRRDRRNREEEEAKKSTASTSDEPDDRNERIRQGFAKAELDADGENVVHEAPGDDILPYEPAEIETPPVDGWIAEKASNPGGGRLGNVAEMSGGDVSRLERSDSSTKKDSTEPAAELAADIPKELPGSQPSLEMSPGSTNSSGGDGGGGIDERSSNASPIQPSSPLHESTGHGRLSPSSAGHHQTRAPPRSRYSAIRTGEATAVSSSSS